MPRARFQRHICHAPDDLLGLVADVERYPEFIKFISALRITKRVSADEFEAEAIVAYKMLREAFRSDVKIDRQARRIAVTKAQKGGALKTLSNDWAFHELSDGSTLIDFSVDVSLSVFLLNRLIASKMDKAADIIMGAFERRAAQICKPAGSKDIDLAAEQGRLGIGIPK